MCAFVIMFMFCAGLGVGGAAIAFCLQTFGSAMTPTWRTQFDASQAADDISAAAAQARDALRENERAEGATSCADDAPPEAG